MIKRTPLKLNDLYSIYNKFKKKIKNNQNVYTEPADNLFVLKKYGESDVKSIYYLIRIENTSGLFANLIWLLEFLFVANERKFKPLIFSSKSCLYYDFVYSSKINTQNFIEYFYELNGGQYLNFIDDINYFHVIDSSFDEISFFNKKYDKYLSHYQKIICNHFVVDMADIYSKYFSLKSNIQLKLEYEIKELEINKSFIAVHVRGTDFRREIKRHPIFLESDEYFKKIDDI